MSAQTKPPTAADARVADADMPGARAWRRWLDDPRFHDLPFKIETNAQGQFVLTYHKVHHSDLQGEIEHSTLAPDFPAKVEA